MLPSPISGKPGGERRQSLRFGMQLPVRYTIGKIHGWGRILNIGSGGAFFTIDQPVKLRQRVELHIGWPVLLHEKVCLNLIATSTIVRVEAGGAAVRFERYHFRTASAAFRRQALLPELRRGTEAAPAISPEAL